MYCNNCGKQLPDGARFCTSCGKMVNNGASSGVNAGYTSGQTVNAEVTSGEKRLWKKEIAYAIGAAALAVTIVISCVNAIGRYTQSKESRNTHQSIDEYFSDDYNGAQPWEYFDDDDDFYGYYGGYGMYGGGQSGGGSQTKPNVSPAPKPTAGPWWPADENGKYPTDEGYKWPSGDGTYEYYANSTIPKFESVTGVSLKKSETEDGNTYYTYEINNDAYNKYIEVLKEKGFKQSEFEVKGQNSYEKYTLGDSTFYEYLIIYHMNSDNELVIMA